jgi:hypothetical protein
LRRLVLVLVVLAAACGGVPTDPLPIATETVRPTCPPQACATLDGVPLGPFRVLVSVDTPPCDRCNDRAGTAVSALERLVPGHPPVAAIALFDPDPFAWCGAAECISSGSLNIFVFMFTDDTTQPVVVRCGVVSCEQVDGYGL